MTLMVNPPKIIVGRYSRHLAYIRFNYKDDGLELDVESLLASPSHAQKSAGGAGKGRFGSTFS